jgi:hypothetical protein
MRSAGQKQRIQIKYEKFVQSLGRPIFSYEHNTLLKQTFLFDRPVILNGFQLTHMYILCW